MTDCGKSIAWTFTASLVATTLLASAFAIADDKALVRQANSPELEWGPCPEFMPTGCGIAVLQGDPTEPNADVFFRLKGGTTAPNHRHTSPERMVLVSGELQVAYEGQEPAVITPGSYAYGPAQMPHSATCLSEEDCVLFIAFEDPIDAMPVE